MIVTGVIPSPLDERVHIYDNLEFKVSNGILPRKFEAVTDPELLSQGFTCWCVSFALANKIFSSNLSRFGKPIKVSQEFIMKHCKDIDGNKALGTTLETGCKVVTKYGACEYSMLPFKDTLDARTNKFSNINQSMIDNAKLYRDDSFARISGLSAIKEAIIRQHGVIARVSVFNNYEGNGDGFIPLPDKRFVIEPYGYHCVEICGWDDDFEKVENGQKHVGYLKIKESDGLKTTANGFRMMSYDAFNSTGYYSKDKLVGECWTTYFSGDLVDPDYHKNHFVSSDDVIEPNRDTIVLTIGSKNAVVNNTVKSLVVSPQVINGTTFVPLRFVTENFKGTYVSWDGPTKSVTVTAQDGKYFKLIIGNKNIIDRSGKVIYTLLAEPYVVNGTTMIPFRAFGELLGAKVGYDPATKKVTLIR